MNVKKSRKIFMIIVVFILLIEILSTVSFAGLMDSVLGESGAAPPPPTPPDAPQTTPPSSSTPSESGPTIPTETITCYTSISGNAYEDLGYKKGENGSDSTKDNENPIEGVTVNLMSGGGVVSSQITGPDGSYSFRPSPGTYSLQFVYGDTSGIDRNNASLMKNVLKYNGQDYITVSAPGKGEYLDMEKIEVTQSGKGALQLFVALDCSNSMRTTMVEYNGKTRTRLDLAVEAAKQLCSTLIDSGNNIYIGLVFFSGTNYRAVSLTKDLSLLNSALDDINTNGWQTANTNIVGAMDKSYESFYNNTEDSNRYLTIISDGVPTSDGNTETYYTDSEATVYSKLDIISQTTINKLKEIQDNGVKVISLMTKSEDPEENSYVESIFKNSTVFEQIEDGYKTVDIIKQALKDYLIANTEEKHYSSSHTVLAGYEDEARRQEVDAQFDLMNYKNTIMFDQIENYTSPEVANDLSNKTKMIVNGGENYTITAVPNPSRIEITETDPDTGETKVVKIIQYVEAAYSGRNLVLAQRPGFSLVTDITATGLRAILQNGQELNVQKEEPGSDFPLVQTLDKELAQGTTIQIEYTISIKNDSSIQCDYLELVNYLPRDFVYDPSIRLITAEGRNEDTGWEDISLEDLLAQNLITQETVDKFNLNSALKLTLDNAGKGENGFYIAPGGEYNIKYVVSRVIGSLDNIANAEFEVASEVLQYKNQSNRRMTYMVGADITHQLAGAYPGDSKDMDFSDDSTNEVIVIPPTGREENYIDVIAKSVLSAGMITSLALICIIKMTIKR